MHEKLSVETDFFAFKKAVRQYEVAEEGGYAVSTV